MNIDHLDVSPEAEAIILYGVLSAPSETVLGRLPVALRLAALQAQLTTPWSRRELASLSVMLRRGAHTRDPLLASLSHDVPPGFTSNELALIYAAMACGVPDHGMSLLARNRFAADRLAAAVRRSVVLPLWVLWGTLTCSLPVVVAVNLHFGMIYDEIFGGERLPPLTRLFVGLSDCAASIWWVLLLVALGACWAIARLHWMTHRQADVVYHTWRKLWWNGRWHHLSDYARICPLVASALRCGHPLPVALRLAAGAAGNRSIRSGLQQAALWLDAGGGIVPGMSEACLGEMALDPPFRLSLALESPSAIAAALDALALCYDRDHLSRKFISPLVPIYLWFFVLTLLGGMMVLAHFMPYFRGGS